MLAPIIKTEAGAADPSAAPGRSQKATSSVAFDGRIAANVSLTGQNNCLVPGCSAPLMHKAVHSARVCPAHRAEMLVVVDGEELRFCQKCRKLQPIGAFDDARHTCRRQLELNRMRRRAMGPSPSGMRLVHYSSMSEGSSGAISEESPMLDWSVTSTVSAAMAAALVSAAAPAHYELSPLLDCPELDDEIDAVLLSPNLLWGETDFSTDASPAVSANTFSSARRAAP